MLAVIGSVTTATRFARLFERDVKSVAKVVQTPTVIKKGGCSYSVRVGEEYTQQAMDIAKQYGITVRQYYSETIVEGKRVYSAIS